MDETKTTKPQRIHNLQINGNKQLSMSGVIAVPSFTDKTIIAELSDKVLTVIGENLHIENLNLETGSLSATGSVISLKYGGSREPSSMLKKLLK